MKDRIKMRMPTTTRKIHNKAPFVATEVWLWFSIAAALLAIAGNIIALSFKSIYAHLTPAFLPQAIAQDIANLIMVAPLWIILAVLALRGSLRAYLLWLGVLTFTVYNYVIYTFSVPFGPLFLLWVAVLGLSLYSLIGGVVAADHKIIEASYNNQRAVTVVAWFMIVVAILFGLLWLSEDIPALLSGNTPQSVIDMAVPTNPVHILDLGFFLPAVIVAAGMLMKRKPLAYTLAPAFIVFLVLTGIPILITPFVQSARGQTATWGVIVPIGTLTVILLGLFTWLLSTIHSDSTKESK
jgi:hypothetical protein